MTTVRVQLTMALRAAMKARDPGTTAALRSTLAALDNAQAVESDLAPVEHEHFAGTAGGLGAGEAPRKALDEAQERAIVAREAQERRDAADDYERHGRDDEAARLRAEAELLAGFA
jgi:uncharacterized protein YqeY